MMGRFFRQGRSWRTSSFLLIGVTLLFVLLLVLASALTVLLHEEITAFHVWLCLSFIPLVIVCLIGFAGRVQHRIDLRFGRVDTPPDGAV